MKQKAWWKSKVLWLNALVLLFATLESQVGLLRELVPANVYALIAVMLPVVNMLLRTRTSMPIVWRADPPGTSGAQPHAPSPPAPISNENTVSAMGKKDGEVIR